MKKKGLPKKEVTLCECCFEELENMRKQAEEDFYDKCGYVG